GGSELSLGLPYPPTVGIWPACLLFLAFAWIELVYPSPAVPAHIAWFAITYSLLTLVGMVAFGREVWLGHGEVLSGAFGTFARFAPLEAKADGPTRQFLLRPFAAGLDGDVVATPLMAFALLLLSTVLYDGLLGTLAWSNLESALRPALSGTA